MVFGGNLEVNADREFLKKITMLRHEIQMVGVQCIHVCLQCASQLGEVAQLY